MRIMAYKSTKKKSLPAGRKKKTQPIIDVTGTGCKGLGSFMLVAAWCCSKQLFLSTAHWLTALTSFI